MPRPAPLPDAAELTDADRWILGRLEEVRAEVDSAFDGYEFSRACESLYHFAWDEFCDWYLELAKVQLADGESRTPPRCWPRCSTRCSKLLHPVMPFVTETLWKALTGGESLVIADWPKPSGFARGSRAAQRIADMQKLVTEVRRFRSDQGLADRQKVPARLSDIDDAGLDGAGPGGDRAGLADRAGRRLHPDGARSRCGCPRGTVVVELDTSGTVDVAAERRRLEKDLAAAQKELAGTTAKLGNEAFLAKAPADVVDKIRDRQQLAARGSRPDHGPPGWARMTAEPHDERDPIADPTPDEIASLLQVEHLLDQRWPETKLEPSTTRIAALMDLLGSPQRSYPSIHIAGTNGKTSVARMIDALLTALHRRTGRTTSPHLQSAVERIAIDDEPITPGALRRDLPRDRAVRADGRPAVRRPAAARR